MSRSDLVYYPVTDSTNRVLREYMDAAWEGFTVVAGEQTCGRGRMGRSFLSPKGGLYMSVLLKPEKDNFSLITAAAAVAVSDVLKERFGVECGIKWVNDLLLDGKKVCGILAESVFDTNGSPKTVILGIGIDMAYPEDGFPDEIKDIAGALGVNLTADEKLDLAEEISRLIVDLYPHPERIVGAYRKRSAVIGKDIFVIRNGVSVPARAVDIDGECGLVADFGTHTEVLRTGEISIRIKD